MQIVKLFGPLFILLFSTVSLAQNLNPTEDWQFYNDYDGITVEYKLDNCTEVQGINGNEVKLVLRFSNTSNNSKTISWRPQWYRDGECVNCHNINSDEFKFELQLNAQEVKEGSACTKDKRYYMFSHWINIVQGMDEKKLTKFEFINPVVK